MDGCNVDVPCDYVPSRYILIYLCTFTHCTLFIYIHRYTRKYAHTHTRRAPTHHLNNGNKNRDQNHDNLRGISKTPHFILIKVKELSHNNATTSAAPSSCISFSMFVLCRFFCLYIVYMYARAQLNVFQHHYALHLIKKNLI